MYVYVCKGEGGEGESRWCVVEGGGDDPLSVVSLSLSISLSTLKSLLHTSESLQLQLHTHSTYSASATVRGVCFS